jgi:ornithine cyclodeaminase/alanine dehydrogenase-like protein (mu-crystallin family)
VRRLLDRDALLRALREAFAAYSTRRTSPRSAPGLRSRARRPDRHGRLPRHHRRHPGVHREGEHEDPGAARSVVGSIHLADLETGDVLAIMDSIVITAERTALAGALAADVLARRERPAWRSSAPACRARRRCARCSSSAVSSAWTSWTPCPVARSRTRRAWARR